MQVTATTEASTGIITPSLVDEAARQFTICNACRYCEGLCAVFPAMERRLSFAESDVAYLANLCHDCRSCIDVCPFATPHVFAVDIPPLMSRIREETYAECTVPRPLARLSVAGVTTLLTIVAVLFVVATAWLGVGTETFFAAHRGPGAFYEVVPFWAMVAPALAIVGFGLGAMYLGARRFLRAIHASVVDVTTPDRRQAILDVLTFRNMHGGGPGCTYPDETPSEGRRLAHTLMFYGFGLALASTTLAAIYQDIFGLLPPYAVWSLPVVLGIAGGIMMLAGGSMMVVQKRRSRTDLESPDMKAMDTSFIWLLILLSVTGFAVLLLRATPLMGLMLAIHLGVVLAFFVTLPYGKFVHSIYRSIALWRHSAEAEEEIASIA